MVVCLLNLSENRAHGMKNTKYTPKTKRIAINGGSSAKPIEKRAQITSNTQQQKLQTYSN